LRLINEFIQSPIDSDCPRNRFRQYLHPEYGLIEISIDECSVEDIESALDERLDEVLEIISRVNRDAEHSEERELE